MKIQETDQMKAEFKKWYDEKPKIIQEAIDKIPPIQTYRFKNSKKECYIISYDEPTDSSIEVTLTVQKTGKGGALAKFGLGSLDTNQVFGVHINDLEALPEDI